MRYPLSCLQKMHGGQWFAELSFTSTAELEPLTTLVGQERATQALLMGLDMTQQGYNIFICGFEGTGCTGPNYRPPAGARGLLADPGDWVYVHNFRSPDQPQVIALDSGQGRRLQQDMTRLLTDLRETLPKAFRQEAFESEQRELGKNINTRYARSKKNSIVSSKKKAWCPE